jgi:hypothetical protein
MSPTPPTDDDVIVSPFVPSWLKWPPNCCESCVGPWVRKGDHWGTCMKSDSLEFGTTTDTRFRCPSFQRILGI